MTDAEKQENDIKWMKECCIAKHVCKVFCIPCEYATSLGYCQITACIKVRPEVKRK